MAWYGPDGRRLYYEDSGGAGDAVVLLPGWAGNIAEFAACGEHWQAVSG